MFSVLLEYIVAYHVHAYTMIMLIGVDGKDN